MYSQKITKNSVTFGNSTWNVITVSKYLLSVYPPYVIFHTPHLTSIKLVLNIPQKLIQTVKNNSKIPLIVFY